MKKHNLYSVSVIIPSFKSEETICRAVSSVLSQKGVNIEVIVVEDGIFDNTGGIVRSIDDDRIKLVQLSKNSGAPWARNIGIDLSCHDLIMFLDADDFLNPDFLYGASRELVSTKADMCFGPWRHESETEIGRISTRKSDDPRMILKEWMLENVYTPPCAILWKKEFVVALGGWKEDLKKNQDLEIAMRAILGGASVTLSSKGHGIYWHTDNPNRISNADPMVFVASMDVIFQEHLDQLSIFLGDKVVGEWCYRYAKIFYSIGQDNGGNRWQIRAKTLGYHGHKGSLLYKLSAYFFGARMIGKIHYLLKAKIFS